MHTPPAPRTGRAVAACIGLACLAATAVTPAAARAATTNPAATRIHATTTVTGPLLEGIPHFDHIVVLTEENEDESTTFGPSSPAHYLNGLKADGVFDPNYYGTGHVSLDNYVAMVSGQPGNGETNSDCTTVSLFTCVQTTSQVASGQNLGDQLDTAGLSWAGFGDGAPSTCFHGPYTQGDTTPDPYQGNSTAAPNFNYADRHVPFLYFTDIIGDQARCAAHQLPYTSLPGELTNDTLPAFSFITPDTCHDGHDSPCAGGSAGGLTSLDSWLSTNGPPLMSYLAAHNGLLVINFDESAVGASAPSSPCSSCVSGGAGGQVGALFISPKLADGTEVDTSYDHFSLLRTVEDSLGISTYLNLAAQSTAMTDVFKTPGSPLPEVPYVPLLLLGAAGALSLAWWRRSRVVHRLYRQ